MFSGKSKPRLLMLSLILFRLLLSTIVVFSMSQMDLHSQHRPALCDSLRYLFLSTTFSVGHVNLRSSCYTFASVLGTEQSVITSRPHAYRLGLCSCCVSPLCGSMGYWTFPLSDSGSRHLQVKNHSHVCCLLSF